VADQLREFTREELQELDGTEGKPAYLVFQGRVIDVSASKHWLHGRHMAAHRAGGDLTPEIDAAPHGPEMLERFPQVGILKAEEAVGKKTPEYLSRLFHYVPLLRRHPHPMVVHFPIVLMMATTGFNLLYLLTGDQSFEITAWHCLWGGVLFTPVAMITGLITWWLNYETAWLRQVKIKLALSPILLVVALAALTWRSFSPDIMISWRSASLVYLGLILSLTPLVGTIGWYGGTLSFPIEK
jgi:predicted heme/steroid binding protein/uncharacterized membrane protein